MRNYVKYLHTFLVSIYLLLSTAQAQVACSSCTSNDFTFNSFYVGDVSGNQLNTSCTVGTPQTAYLWMNVTNNSTRYSLKVYYQLVEHDYMNGTTSTTTVENCLYNNVAIPQTLINLGTISWTCGNALEITNFQMHWKQNNSISCSYDAPKCLCVANTYISQPLITTFTYSGCNNGTTTTIAFTSNVVGGLAPYTYNWSFGDATSSTLANPSHTYNNPGPYTATLTIQDAFGTVSTYSQSITFPAAVTSPTVSVTQPTCSVSTGTITVTAPTGAGITYSIDGINYQASNTFSGVASGSYSVTYKNASGCTSGFVTATINVQPATPAAPTVSVTQPTCSVATGTITVTAPTGAGMTYSIDGINYQASTTFSGVTSGSYSVTAKSSGGCVSTATTATVNAQPATPAAPTVSVTQPTCSVATGTITVSAPTGAGMTYSKDGINYQASTTFSGVTSGSYPITAKGSNGCISTATTATVNAQPATPAAPTVSVTQPTCSVATGTITVSAPTGAGMTYSKDGINYQASTTFSGVATGSYSITAKGSNGCVSTATTATVNAQPATPAAPTVSITQPTCSVATGTITVTAPTGAGMTYSIDGINYQASTTFSGVASGSYSVTAKGSNGCVSAATTATVNAQPATPAAPTVSVTQPTCSVATGTITVSAPTGAGITYSKDGINYQVSTTFSGVTAGSYSITAKSSSGCVSTATTATVNTQPATPTTPTVGLTQPTCSVATGTITVSAPTGAGITYSIDGINYQASTTFSGVTAGSYSVTAKGSNGCVSSATIANINAQPATPATPTVSANGPTIFCSGGSVTLTSSSATGNQWYLNGNPIGGATNQTLVVNASGSYTVIVTGVSGCSSSPSSATVITVNSNPIVGAISGMSPLCEAVSTTYTSITPSGVWSSSNNSIATVNSISGVVTGVSAGTATISYTVTNGSGCSTTVNKIIVIESAPTATITASGSTTTCAGGGFFLTSSAGNSYQWYLNGVAIPGAIGQTYFPTASGTYTVEITYASGCVVTSAGVPVTIVTISATTIAANGPTTICSSGSVQLCPAVWGWSNYQWYLNGVAMAAPVGTSSCITVNTAGSYTLSVQNGAGCWSNPSAAVVVTISAAPASPTISAGGPTTFCAGGNVTLSSSVVTGNQWYLNGSAIAGATNQNYVATLPGTYTVTTSNGGCESAPSTGVAVVISNAIAPTLSSPSTELCSGSITITSNIATGNQWYLNGVLIPGATNQTYDATVAGTYTVVNTQGTCVINSSNSIVIVSSASSMPTIAAPDGTNVCIGGSIQLCPAAWGYSNYQWYKNGVAIPAPIGTSACLTLTDADAGSYTLAGQNGAGCWSSQSAAVVVTAGGACSVSSGGGGGVESKSIGAVIASRLFGNAKQNKTELNGVANGIKFIKSGTVVNGINDLSLQDLTPASVVGTDMPYVSSPTDLVNFTNAKDVFAVDYSSNNVIRAVSFSTKTLGGIYSHTKPICDRLKGAELKEVKIINVNGYDLMAYKIRQRTGQIEYAMNLSAGTAVTRNTISLQSNWFTDNYQSDETLYNFQLWAVNYAMVIDMAQNIISKLQYLGTVNSVTATDLPKIYVTKGTRKNTEIEFVLHNNTTFTNGYFELSEKANETLGASQTTIKQIAFTATANGYTTFSLPVSDHYEGDIKVYLNNKLTDLVYMADGSWSIDYNKNNSVISKFNIVNEVNPTVNANEHRLFRNVEVSGNVDSYVSVYKTMMGGGLDLDLSSYKSIIFNANTVGADAVKVTLLKKSITAWDDQYSSTIYLNGNKEYTINLSQFKSKAFADPINANDITAVSFSFTTGGRTRNVTINLSNVRFSNVVSTVVAATVEETPVFMVYPNPVEGQAFNISFNSNKEQALVLKVIDAATGRVAKVDFINAVKGENKKIIALQNALLNGSYLITLEGDDVKYKSGKIILKRLF